MFDFINFINLYFNKALLDKKITLISGVPKGVLTYRFKNTGRFKEKGWLHKSDKKDLESSSRKSCRGTTTVTVAMAMDISGLCGGAEVRRQQML